MSNLANQDRQNEHYNNIASRDTPKRMRVASGRNSLQAKRQAERKNLKNDFSGHENKQGFFTF